MVQIFLSLKEMPPKLIVKVFVILSMCHEWLSLMEIFKLYIGLAETHAKEVHSLNKILPEMCEAPGFKQKTAHSLHFTCVSSLVNAGMEEKLICKRSGYRSNALFEKPTEENVSKISKILHVHVGPSVTPVSCSTTEKQDKSIAFKDVVFQNGKFKNSTINVTVSKKE